MSVGELRVEPMSSASTLDLQKRLPRQACLSPLTGGVAGGTRGVVPLPSPVKGKGDSRPTVDEVSSTRAETAMAIGPRDQSNEEIARKIDRHALRLGQDDHGSKASLRRAGRCAAPPGQPSRDLTETLPTLTSRGLVPLATTPEDSG
jgi:hypothetical protein